MSIFDKIKNVFTNTSSEDSQLQSHGENKNQSSEASLNDSLELVSPFDSMELKVMMNIEYRFYMNPENYKVRIYDDAPITLTEFLNKTLGIKKEQIKEIQVITDSWLGKNYRNVGKDEIATYDLMNSDYCKKNEEGEIVPRETNQNMMLNVVYEDGGKDLNLFMHYRGIGCLCADFFWGVPVSIMYENAENHQYESTLVYAIYEKRTNEPLTKKIEKTRERAINKVRRGEQLTYDEACSIDLAENDVNSRISDGNNMMKENRWGDAIEAYDKAFEILNGAFLRNDLSDEYKNTFYDLCSQLGDCYLKLQLYPQAIYYHRLANSMVLNKMRHEKLLEALAMSHDKMRSSDFAETTKLGVILSTIFCIHPSEISDMLIFSGKEQISRITSQEEIWNFDFIGMSDKHYEFTAYLSYRTYRDIVAEKYLNKENISIIPEIFAEKQKNIPYGSIDASKRRTDSDVIIHFTRRGEIVNVDVMAPEFQLSKKFRYVPLSASASFGVRVSLSDEEFARLRQSAKSKIDRKEMINSEEAAAYFCNSHIGKLYIMGERAFHSKTWGDAIYYLTLAYNEFETTYLSKNERDENVTRLFFMICYYLGFYYMEIKKYDYAVYYLEFIGDLGYIPYTQEYINSISNSKDVRALSFIASEIKALGEGKYHVSEQESSNYLSFLKRRFGYVLVDTQQWDEAEDYFKQILDDQSCRQFAIDELNYISRVRQQG